MSAAKLKIGISSCLLGNRVRHDGGHKRDGFLNGTLGDWFEWVSVCPEVESGLPTPRESMRLVQRGREITLETTKTKLDKTDALTAFSKAKTKSLQTEDLAGFIVKKSSPSCGMERVTLYGKEGERRGFTSGLFTSHLQAEFPLLPVEEEGRLGDANLRENWLGRVFLYARLKELWKQKWGLKDLVAFHTSQKFLVLAHSPAAYSALGKIVAQSKGVPRAQLKAAYETGLMQAAAIRATRGRHTNVLQHMVGYVRTHLDSESRKELESNVMRYRKGEIPLLVPLTLIHHHARLHKVKYLLDQVYLDPSRRELRTF